MGGFTLHELLPKLKVRVTAIHQHGERLYVGTATGALQVYSFEIPNESGSHVVPIVKLLKTHTLSKRAIDQIGVLEELQQVIVLSDTVVTLYPLDFGKGSLALSAARYAHAFATSSYSSNKASKDGNGPSTVRRDLLVVGCRKKVVLYGAGKTFKDPWELSLQHSPRAVIFPSAPSPTSPLPETLHLLFSPSSSVILHINPSSSQRLSISELSSSPPPPAHGSGRPPDHSSGPSTASVDSSAGAAGGSGLGMGMGALTGLGGYVGLGGKAAVPVGTRTVGGEVVIVREDLGVFYSTEGNFTREESIQWPAPPEAISYSNPFIYSIVPTAQSGSTQSLPIPCLQVHLAPTLGLRQSITLPLPPTGSVSFSAMTIISKGSSTVAKATSSAARVIVVATPTDKALATGEGSSVWALEASDIGEQIDDLVKEGKVLDAIGLAEAVGDSSLSPTRRLPHLRTLCAVQQFAQGQYQSAMDTFLIFNVNPALVISLFPAAAISGRLHTPRSEWMELFGAVEGSKLEPEDLSTKSDEPTTKALLKKVAGIGLTKKASMDTLRTTGKDDDAASVMSSDKEKPSVPLVDDTVIPRQALEALMFYLSDRRQKLTGAIAALSEPLPAESTLPPLSALSSEELHQLPSIPMTELEPDQLLRVAQVIYTALIKVYLVARPVLVGSLCRIENWCDVEEVEELLKEKKKLADLIDLYQGKRMHSKALAMLHDLAKDEEDKLDRYPPTIRYLQKLGPTELSLIFDASRWVFKEESEMALQIFTADEPEVEALPRKDVVAFLEKESSEAYQGYLEHIINVLGEDEADFHDKLAEIYLAQAKAAKKRGENDQGYPKLLAFLDKSTSYRAYRLISRINENDMPEAKAILLGRLGKHQEALRVYVYKLKDYSAAETYCAREYLKEPDPKGIFLLLLTIYLRPTPSSDETILLSPALSLISTHGTRLDASSVLELLPPLVTMEDVRAFFIKTLRGSTARKNDHRIVKSLVSARKEEVERTLMGLQVKRVRVTDQRICPQCQKRLGTSALAVHAPRGEVTHLHCKDGFSAKLAKVRS